MFLFACPKRNRKRTPSPEEFFAIGQKPFAKLRALKKLSLGVLLHYSAEKGANRLHMEITENEDFPEIMVLQAEVRFAKQKGA